MPARSSRRADRLEIAQDEGLLCRPRVLGTRSKQGETQMHADQKGCTQILAEPTLTRTPEPRVAPMRHPGSSLLICVHLRFHFLLPEQMPTPSGASDEPPHGLVAANGPR